MEKLNPTSILKFNDNQLQNVRKSFGYDDLNKLNQDLQNFEDWIQKQNHFKIREFDRGFLERLLVYNKGSIERAKQRLDKLYTFNNLMPEFLQNFDVKNEFSHLTPILNTCVLPKPTADNYRVLVSSCTGDHNDEWSFISYYRYMAVLCEYMMFNDYCYGYEFISDSRKLQMAMLTKLNPLVVHKGLTLIIEALGQRMKKLHMIAGGTLFETLLIIMKQGLSAKLSKRLIIHQNIESLYEHIPKEMLPSDFGGEEKSVKELSDMNFKEFTTDEHLSRVKFLESAKTDESLRLNCKFNEEYSGMPGSFKTLCVD